MERFYSQNSDQSFLVKAGNEKLMLIMVGSDGMLRGYNDKYIRIAEKIHDTYGATIIASENPRRPDGYPASYNFDVMTDFAERYMQERYAAYEILFMGVSLGGSYGLMYAHRHEHIRRVLAVNAPFMINTHKLLEGIRSFNGESISLIYGDKDPSYKLMTFFRQLKSPMCEVVAVIGADHNFANMENAFITLPEKYLF